MATAPTEEIIRVSCDGYILTASLEPWSRKRCVLWVALYKDGARGMQPYCSIVGVYNAPFEWHQAGDGNLDLSLVEVLQSVPKATAKTLRTEFAKHVQ